MNYNRLEEIRKRQGFSQDGLAKAIGMTKNGYQEAIKHSTLRIDKLEKIAEALGVEISVFFNDENKPGSDPEIKLNSKSGTVNISMQQCQRECEQLRKENNELKDKLLKLYEEINRLKK